MERNIEIKATVDDMSRLKDQACKLSGKSPTVLRQRDTFFDVTYGRLKLREIEGDKSQLIFYDRPNISGPKLSSFCRYTAADLTALKNVLSHSNGVKGEVCKTRYLFNIGQTRVHLDEVEGLGSFMELEVVLEEGQSVEEGEVIAKDLLSELGIPADNLLTGAYIDMISCNRT